MYNKAQTGGLSKRNRGVHNGGAWAQKKAHVHKQTSVRGCLIEMRQHSAKKLPKAQTEAQINSRANKANR